MKKKLFALFTALLLLSLTACGGKGGSNGSAAADSAAPSTPQSAPSLGEANMNYDMYLEEVGWDVPMEPSPAPNPDTTTYGGGNIPANAKIIYTADMDLETKEFDAAVKALSDIVQELGGYFESRSVNQGGYYRSINCTIRVPVENFTTFLDRAGEAAHLTNRSEYLEDVSENYYDQEARLTTQRTKLARLQELLRKAEDMADIITIESAISETELQIEYLTGSLRKYDSLISYSTVTLYLREVYRLSTDEEVPVTFGDRFLSAFSIGFQRGVDGLEDFAISVARNWVSLLILAVILAAAILFLRRHLRLRKASRATPMPQPPERAEESKDDTPKE